MNRGFFALILGTIILLGTLLLRWQQKRISELRTTHAPPLAPATHQAPRQDPPSPELLKLRAEVTALRRELKEAAPPRASSKAQFADEWAQVHSGPKPSDQPGFIATTNLINAGHATPEAAFQSFLYVLRNQHKEKLTPTKTKEIFDVPDEFDDPDARYSIHLGEGIGRESGYRVVQQEFVGTNELKLIIDFEDRHGGSFRGERILVQRDGRWRVKPAGVQRQN